MTQQRDDMKERHEGAGGMGQDREQGTGQGNQGSDWSQGGQGNQGTPGTGHGNQGTGQGNRPNPADRGTGATDEGQTPNR